MHIHHDHLGGAHDHEHSHSHTHEHTHDGHTHSHEHSHTHTHDHSHPHEHNHLHGEGHTHDHSHCSGGCGSCDGGCEHTPAEELVALMRYMVNHNAAHARELADLAAQVEKVSGRTAYEQIMAAVSDFEKGNLRLSTVLAAMDVK